MIQRFFFCRRAISEELGQKDRAIVSHSLHSSDGFLLRPTVNVIDHMERRVEQADPKRPPKTPLRDAEEGILWDSGYGVKVFPWTHCQRGRVAVDGLVGAGGGYLTDFEKKNRIFPQEPLALLFRFCFPAAPHRWLARAKRGRARPERQRSARRWDYTDLTTNGTSISASLVPPCTPIWSKAPSPSRRSVTTKLARGRSV